MRNMILASLIVFGFTACDERVGRGIKAPTPQPLSMQMKPSNTESMPLQIKNEEVTLIKDIPILENTLPTLTTPTNLTKEKASKKVSTPTPYTSSKGLDIATIRISNTPTHTRVVLDNYHNGSKAYASGKYSYRYDAQHKYIILTLKEYSNLSALKNTKTRNYPSSSRVKKIFLQDTTNTDTTQLIIALRDNAKVNVFDIKEPGRIVIDISPR